MVVVTASEIAVSIAASWILNEQVKNVLRTVETLSESLQTAGLALSQVSENESSSAQELAATSEQLMNSSIR